MINKNNSKCFVLIVDGGELLNKCKENDFDKRNFEGI